MDELAPLEELVSRSSFIFTGTVTNPAGSAMPALASESDLAVVQLDRTFRVNPVLGDLTGRPITVWLGNTTNIEPGQRAIFFTQHWVHGQEIAVREMSRIPADESTERRVEEIVSSLPRQHLQQRLDLARYVVQGTVRAVERATDIHEFISHKSPRWARAAIDVQRALKGEPPAEVTVYFPTSNDVAYRDVPTLEPGQTGVFLLHLAPEGRTPLPQGALVLPDQADVQPAGELRSIRALLRNQ